MNKMESLRAAAKKAIIIKEETSKNNADAGKNQNNTTTNAKQSPDAEKSVVITKILKNDNRTTSSTNNKSEGMPELKTPVTVLKRGEALVSPDKQTESDTAKSDTDTLNGEADKTHDETIDQMSVIFFYFMLIRLCILIMFCL